MLLVFEIDLNMTMTPLRTVWLSGPGDLVGGAVIGPRHTAVGLLFYFKLFIWMGFCAPSCRRSSETPASV